MKDESSYICSLQNKADKIIKKAIKEEDVFNEVSDIEASSYYFNSEGNNVLSCNVDVSKNDGNKFYFNFTYKPKSGKMFNMKVFYNLCKKSWNDYNKAFKYVESLFSEMESGMGIDYKWINSLTKPGNICSTYNKKIKWAKEFISSNFTIDKGLSLNKVCKLFVNRMFL